LVVAILLAKPAALCVLDVSSEYVKVERTYILTVSMYALAFLQLFVSAIKN
jgi:hypothetical protein